MTRTEIRERARFILRELGTHYVEDDPASAYGLDDAVTTAYRRYAVETKCFLVRYSILAIADQAVYAFEAFGSEAADVDALAVDADAANTTALTLIDDQPDNTYLDRHYVTVTITNGTGGTATGNASNYTVVGTQYGGIAYSEVLAFVKADDLTNIANGGSVTKTSAKPFATVTSITPSAAQPADWTHSAGVGAQTPGTRIIEPCYIGFNEKDLGFQTEDYLNQFYPNWRWDNSATPVVCVPWGDRLMRLHPAPSTAYTIRGEFYETPDTTLFNADSESPNINPIDHELLAEGAVSEILVYSAERGNRMALAAPVHSSWKEGLAAARRRIHAVHKSEIIVGRWANMHRSEWPPYNDTITNIT